MEMDEIQTPQVSMILWNEFSLI